MITRTGIGVFCVALGIAAAFPAAHAGPDDVPAPTVTGPIQTLTSHPFFSTYLDLESVGYVEEEFFFEGQARRYVSGLLTSQGQYKTRMVVRRPVRPEKFNGVVVVEWYNVTAGYDQEYDWFASHDYLMREGYAWVGVSAQIAGVLALQSYDSDRYGSLIVSDDQLSEDIYSQAGRAMFIRSGSDPLGGLQPRLLIASGHSQSTVKLAGYHNNIHPLHGIYAGFLLRGAQTALRTDLDTKVMRVYSETDVGPEVTASSANQDTAPDTNVYRRWDVTGTSHASYYEKLQGNYLQARDRGSVTPAVCLKEPFSRLPYHYVHNAAYDHLVRWVEDGEAPPIAPRIQHQLDGLTVARDARGFAIGGYRLPELVVPRALNTGDNQGPGFCFLYGSYEPYDAVTLLALYPTRADYVGKLNVEIQKSFEDGFLLAPDAEEICREARRADFGWIGAAAELPGNVKQCPVKSGDPASP